MPPGKGRYPLGVTSRELTQGLSCSKAMQGRAMLPRKQPVLHSFCCNNRAVVRGHGEGGGGGRTPMEGEETPLPLSHTW